MTANGFALPEPFSQFSVSLAATAALITDPDDRVLLVRPHHNPYWTFVGGMLDVAEAPHEGCAREIKEEIGLDLAVGGLLVADWAPPLDRRPLPIAYYIFDCGTLPDLDAVRMQTAEIAEIAFLPVEEAAERLAPNVTTRLPAAIAARGSGAAIYLPGGAPADSP